MLEIISEFLTLHRLSSPQPFEDELTRGLRTMFDTHEIPFWLVFAAQVFLDIRHTLRDGVQRGFADLTRSAKAIETSIRENLDFHSSLRIDGWPKKNDAAFYDLLEHIHKAVDSDPMQPVKEHLGVRPGETFKLMKWHPLLCGIWTYNLKARYQELCLLFQAAWGSIMCSAHLYNAPRKEKLLSRQWTDMNLVMSWHGEIFVGEPPSRPQDYLKRFTLSMGGSTTSYARNRRQTAALPEAKKGPKTMKPIANVSRVFFDRYCNGSRKTGSTEADLKKALAEGVWINDEKEEEGGVILMSCNGKATLKQQWESIH